MFEVKTVELCSGESLIPGHRMLPFFQKLSKKYKDALWRLCSDAPAAVVLDNIS